MESTGGDSVGVRDEEPVFGQTGREPSTTTPSLPLVQATRPLSTQPLSTRREHKAKPIGK